MSSPPSDGEQPLEVVVQHDSRFLDPAICLRALTHVFEGESISVGHITLILADHATVRDLNRTYLDHDFDTDVLAFSYSEEGEALDGEIYVDLDTAAERHEEFAASFEEEALRYAVHGALHLAGYRDKSEDGKQAMHSLEDKYLRMAGLRSPR